MPRLHLRHPLATSLGIVFAGCLFIATTAPANAQIREFSINGSVTPSNPALYSGNNYSGNSSVNNLAAAYQRLTYLSALANGGPVNLNGPANVVHQPVFTPPPARTPLRRGITSVNGATVTNNNLTNLPGFTARYPSAWQPSYVVGNPGTPGFQKIGNTWYQNGTVVMPLRSIRRTLP